MCLEGGKEYPDFLAFTGAGKQLFLLSNHAVECLRGNGITGFSDIQPVAVSDEKGEILIDAPKYRHLEITDCVDLDFSAMQLKKKRLCPPMWSVSLEQTENACFDYECILLGWLRFVPSFLNSRFCDLFRKIQSGGFGK